MDKSIKPSTPDPSAGEWQLGLWPADWGGWSRATALLAGVPATVLAALWTPSAVWGLPEPDQSRYPELSFTGALVGHSSDVAAQTCPRYETLPKIKEGEILALRIERTAGQWPYEQTIPVDFEILTGSTADASDLGTRKTLQKVSLRFRSAERFKAIQCHHVDIAKDLKLEGEELLSLRLKPKLGSYRVKSGADRRTINIAEEGAGILVRYGDETLGSVSSQRDFTVRLEAGALPSSSPTGGRSCSLRVDTSFNRTIAMDWRVRPGKDPRYGAASLADFTLPSRVTFRNGVAEIKVSAKMDGDTVAEDFKLDRVPQRQEYPALLNLCEPASVSVPSGVLSAAVFGVIAPAASAPSQPTGLGATASEDQVNLAWTASSDETITGWRYRLRSKGLSRWGSAVAVPSSGSATRRYGVSTSAYFHGVATEFQVQSYNAVGSSPWSDAATATVVNADNPILSISKEGVTVKEGESDTWTVKLNGAVAGTVRLSEAERSHAGAVRLSPEVLTFTEGNAQTPQTVTVTGVNAGTVLLQGKRTGEVVVNHGFTLSGSSTTTLAAAGEVEVTVVEGGEVPGAPQRFEARPGNTQVRLEWAAPEDESITGYEVRQRVAGNGGGRWSGWRAVSGSGALTTSHVVGKLVNGEKYLFQLRAVNGVGEGAASKRKGATPMGALTVAVGDGRMVEGDEGKKEMEFKVRLSGETVHDVKLQATAVAGAGSTATATGAGRDFLPLSQSVVFAAYGRQHGKRTDVNDLEQTVRVEVVGDHLAEGDESFQLRLDNLESEDKRVALAGGGEKTTAVGVIVDDDAAPVLASLADVTVTAGEEVAITAAATDADGDTVSYTWSRKATETTPALPQGTVLNQARLAFTPTEAGVYTMTVTASDGHGNTATEEVTVTVGAPATVSVPATLQVTEGTDSNAVVTVTASRAFGEAVTFNVSYGGSATAEVDYDNAVSAVTFNATDTSKDIRIPITDDNLDEDNETITVSVTPSAALPGGFELGNATTTVTITDDDASPVLAPLAAVSVAKFETVDITASATDADGDTLSYRWSRADATPGDSNYYCYTYVQDGEGWSTTELGGQRLRFTPATSGSCNMSVTVDDGHGNTHSRTVVVTVSNQQVSRPDRPTGLVAQPGNGEVSLSWDDPSDTSITGYQLRQKAKGGRWGAWIGIQGSGAQTVSHTISGLSNGTLYTYKIRAVNGVGHSEESKGVKATPQYLRLTLGGPGTIDEGDEGQTEIVFTAQLSGSPPHDVRLEAEVTEVQGRVRPGYYLWSATLTGDERDVVPFTKTIVFPANARGDALRQEVRVTVLGDHRDEEDELIGLWLKGSQETDHERMWFNERSAYFGAYIDAIIIDDDASPVLEALEDVTVTAGQAVDITAAATDEDGDTISYAWSRKAGETTPALPQGTALNQARLTFTPAAAGVYTMTVTADDGYGNTATEEVTITVGAAAIPAKPTGFKASGGNQQVTLSWDNPGNANISKWQVRQKIGSGSWGSWVDISGSSAVTVSHTVTGLTNGTAYGFKIRAVAGTVEGAASDEVSATPEGVLRVTVIGDSGVTEGDEGQTEMVFTVQLSGSPSHEVKLQAQAGGVGANVGATSTGDERDVIPVTQAIVFPANARGDALRQEVRLVVLGDHRDERDEAVMLWLSNLQSEDKRVGIYAHEAAANRTDILSSARYIIDDDASPVLEALEDVTVTAGQEVDITASATDADGDTVSYAWSRKAEETTPALPQGTALDQARLTFTPAAAGVYTMTVTADDGYGNTATEEVTITVGAPVASAPAKPTGLQASGGNQQVILYWNDPGNANITKWQVRQKTGSNSYGPWVDIPGSSATTVSHTVTGLTNGTLYTYKIRAMAGAVEGVASDEVSVTVKGVTAPMLSVTQSSDPSAYYAKLTWTVADPEPHAIVENADTITGWIVEWRNPGSPWLLPGIELGAESRTQNHNFLKKGRTSGTIEQVEFRVRAKGERQGSATVIYGPWSNTVTVTLADETPAQPTGFTASPGNQQVSLAWDSPNNESITGYELRQKVSGGSWGEWTAIQGSVATTVSHRVTGLSNGTEYVYQIRAVSGAGAGEASESVKATPDLSLAVPPSLWVKLSTGRNGVICNVDDSQCNSTNYKSRGSRKTVWYMDIGHQGGSAQYKPTGLQIQYLRTDRLEEGPSEWIDTGWCLGDDCDGPVTTPWPGMIDSRRLFYYQGAHLIYEPVPYEISVRVRMVNAAGAGHASSWMTFKGGEYRSANYHSYDEGARISVSDATVREAAGAELAFKVTLDRSKSQRPQSGLLHVRYVTRDVTATAGEDYTATSGHVSFAPGETEKVVKVAVLEDSHDEASETMELVLWELDYPFGATRLRDAVGTGTITNTDPIPAAWLGRFGRTVADQALDAVSDRIAAERTPGLSGSLAGQELPHMPFGNGSQEKAEVVSDTTTASDVGDALSEAIYQAATASDSMSGQDLLLGTNFSLSRGADATGGNFTFWGRAAYSGFDGKEGDLSLDGEVVTGLLGMDYARQRWMLGLAVSRSGGTGSYNGSGAGAMEGKIEASLTAGVPYGAWQASERVKLWGALGYGRGEMTLKPKEQDEIKADLDWTMAAVGARAALLDPEGEGLSLDLLSDALWTRTTSEKVDKPNLAGSEAEVTRLRLGLEGSWANLLQGGGQLTPKFSLGARLDGGDAETGFGMELGGGVVWSSPGLGLSLDLDGRTLLFHEADGLKDWGFSAGLVFDPQPESERGLSVTLGQDWGGEATGGIDALFAANPLEQRSGVEGTSRWTLEAAYGLPAFAGRFTGAPYVGLALAAGARDYTVGWRLTPEVTEQDITFEVKATRSESSDARPDHGVELDIRRTW